MSSAACGICGGSTSFAFLATDRNRSLTNERFAYRRCDACRTLSLVPVPADLGRYYPAEYYALPRDRQQLLTVAQSERYKLDIVRPFVASGRLVELGPAVGAFSILAQEAGYQTGVIEMDAACCEFLRTVGGIEVHESAEPAEVFASQSGFDVIAMWHVIEHLPDPAEVLSAAAKALAPGGVLALSTPNPDAFQFFVLRSRWTHVDAPRHLFLIPPAALAALGRRLGLAVVLLTTLDPGTLGWNWFGWRESLAGFGRGPRTKRALRLAGSALSKAAAPLDRRDRRGSTYTLVLRRPPEACRHVASAVGLSPATAAPAPAPRIARPTRARRHAG